MRSVLPSWAAIISWQATTSCAIGSRGTFPSSHPSRTRRLHDNLRPEGNIRTGLPHKWLEAIKITTTDVCYMNSQAWSFYLNSIHTSEMSSNMQACTPHVMWTLKVWNWENIYWKVAVILQTTTILLLLLIAYVLTKSSGCTITTHRHCTESVLVAKDQF